MQITGEPKQRELTSGEFGAYVDQEITIHGAIHSIRMMSDFAFVIIRTARETVQCVYAESFSDYRLAQNVVENASVKVTGLVVAGADKEGNVRYELQIHNIEVLSVPAELPPVVINKKQMQCDLNTKIDYRAVTLRNPKERAIFKIQEGSIISARRYSWRSRLSSTSRCSSPFTSACSRSLPCSARSITILRGTSTSTSPWISRWDLSTALPTS